MYFLRSRLSVGLPSGVMMVWNHDAVATPRRSFFHSGVPWSILWIFIQCLDCIVDSVNRCKVELLYLWRQLIVSHHQLLTLLGLARVHALRLLRLHPRLVDLGGD